MLSVFPAVYWFLGGGMLLLYILASSICASGVPIKAEIYPLSYALLADKLAYIFPVIRKTKIIFSSCALNLNCSKGCTMLFLDFQEFSQEHRLLKSTGYYLDAWAKIRYGKDKPFATCFLPQSLDTSQLLWIRISPLVFPITSGWTLYNRGKGTEITKTSYCRIYRGQQTALSFVFTAFETNLFVWYFWSSKSVWFARSQIWCTLTSAIWLLLLLDFWWLLTPLTITTQFTSIWITLL